MPILKFLLYLVVMAGVTYLIRMIPLIAVRHKIENRFIVSFLYYVPYTVLTVMTVPAILYATSSLISAVVGFAVALLLAYFERSLVTVAAGACGAVFLCELLMMLV